MAKEKELRDRWQIIQEKKDLKEPLNKDEMKK